MLLARFSRSSSQLAEKLKFQMGNASSAPSSPRGGEASPRKNNAGGNASPRKNTAAVTPMKTAVKNALEEVSCIVDDRLFICSETSLFWLEIGHKLSGYTICCRNDNWRVMLAKTLLPEGRKEKEEAEELAEPNGNIYFEWNMLAQDDACDSQQTLFNSLLLQLDDSSSRGILGRRKILLVDRRGAEIVIALAMGLVLNWKLAPNVEQVFQQCFFFFDDPKHLIRYLVRLMV